MSKRSIEYLDNEILFNGTTTIVYGEAKVDLEKNLHEAKMKAERAIDTFLYGGASIGWEGKGVAKLYPGDETSTADVYDQNTGMILASKRAEVNALRKARQSLLAAKKAHDQFGKELDFELLRIEKRIGSLSTKKNEKE